MVKMGNTSTAANLAGHTEMIHSKQTSGGKTFHTVSTP
jgi:hypothetical protein